MTRDTLGGVSDAADKAKAQAKEIAAKLEESAHEAAEVVEDAAAVMTRKAKGAMTRLERGVASANRALATPEDAELAPLLGSTDLPELQQESALDSLGVRLDREADLYRNVGLRELGRVAWIDRVTLIVVLVAFIGEVAIAATATFSAIVGASEGRGGMFALAALVLAVAAAGAVGLIASSRRMHRELAAEASARAHAIEDQLFQLAVALEWRKMEPALFQDGLARLEGRFVKAPE